MKKSILVGAVCACPLLFTSLPSHSGSINGGDLLDQAGASLLETWLGTGDLDFTNVSDLSIGGASSQWHADVVGLTNVISIYEVWIGDDRSLVGGYSSLGHDTIGYTGAGDEFIFNLTDPKVARLFEDGGTPTDHAQYNHPGYFATYGGGHDLYGGAFATLGAGPGYNDAEYILYRTAAGWSYDQGTTNMFGQATPSVQQFRVSGLESFIYAPAAEVPIPAAGWLFMSALVGLVGKKRLSRR